MDKPLTPKQQRKADFICAEIAKGKSVRAICRDTKGLTQSVIYTWLAKSNTFQEQYARARLNQADTLFDEILEIADDGRNDTYVDDQGVIKTNQDVIARSRLRVDSRKWMAGKLRPKKYGDKIDVNGNIKHGLSDDLTAILAGAMNGKKIGS